MNIGNILIAIVVVLTLAVIAIFVVKTRIPRKLKTDRFATQWKELQQFCRDKQTWPQALEAADSLLDVALRRRKFKGKSMGERMVSAQKIISNNDAMWFAHNLTKKVAADPTVRLKESEVKSALVGFRSALKDIGALRTEVKQPVTDQQEVRNG